MLEFIAGAVFGVVVLFLGQVLGMVTNEMKRDRGKEKP